MRLTQGDLSPREGRGLLVGNFSFKSRSSPSNAQLASAGEGPLANRLAEVANRLRQFYGDGKRACLLDTLTLGGSPPAIQRHAKLTLAFWINKFEKLARESGLAPATARLAAEDAVAALEGGLVLARVSGDRDAFRRAVESLGERLTKAARRI